MKIAIIVLSGGEDISHSNGKTYDEMVDTIRDTWAKRLPNNVDVFFNYGFIPNFDNNPKLGETKIYKDMILHGVQETYENMNEKVLNSLSYFEQNTNYNFVFRCCCGSYINVQNLVNFLSNKPRKKFYCGVPTPYHYKEEEFKFASGSGFFFSKDVLKIITENLNKMVSEEIALDDVTIGYHLRNFGINIYPGARRKDIGDLPENKKDLIDLKCLTKNDLTEYHFHMRHNAEGMKTLHRLFKEKIYCKK